MRLRHTLAAILLATAPLLCHADPAADAAAAAKTARDINIHHMMVRMSTRLVALQQTQPDPNIQKIIKDYTLQDTAALDKLDANMQRTVVVGVASALYQASSKGDTLATQLMKEFDITFTPGPTPAPPAKTP